MSSNIITDKLVNWLTKDWTDTTSLIPPPSIEVPVSSQEMERPCIFVRVLILPQSRIFLMDFKNVPTVWYFRITIVHADH